MRFKKGQSGNPRGRPVMSPEVREALRAGGEVAVRRMGDLLDDDAAWGPAGWLSPMEQIKLLAVAHERAFGRAVAMVLDQQFPGAGDRALASDQHRRLAALIPKH